MKISNIELVFSLGALCVGQKTFSMAQGNTTPVASSSSPHLVGELKGAGTIEISPDGKWLFAEGNVNWQSIARLWNLEDGSAQDVKIKGGDLTWTRDNRLLDTGLRYRGKQSELSSPTAWICSPRHVGQWQQFGDELFTKDLYDVEQANVSPDGTEFWLLTRKMFRRFRTRDGLLISRIRWGDANTKRSTGTGTEASISFDGREILQGEQKINFYSAKTGKRLRQLPYLFRQIEVKFRGNGEFEEWLPVTDWKETPQVIKRKAGSNTYNDNLSSRAIRDSHNGKILRRESAISNDAAIPTVQNARFKFYLEYDKIWRQAK